MTAMRETRQHNVTTIVEENQPRLKAFIRKRVPNDEDAADVLQDVFYQLSKVDLLLDPIGSVTAWLYRVARNMIINRRKKKREEPLPYYQNEEGEYESAVDFGEALFGGEAPSPETEYLRSLVWIDLENALAELPPEQRQAYEMTEIEGLSGNEAAQRAGVTLNTLLSRKHYATRHLRKRLEQTYDELILPDTTP